MMDQEKFQEEVLHQLKKLNKGFESLFGNEETKDKGQVHWIKQRLTDLDKRITTFEKIKQFSSGVLWAFGAIFSTIIIVLWEGGKHMILSLLHL